jgi:radical SAM superfamily enzyme YgiQ (UPF0313 family)
MKLLLVKPSYYRSDGKLYKTRKAKRRELTLPLLAALTPGYVDVKIADETLEDICFDTDCDLVGISSLTRNISRAYEIADQFRRRKKTVIMGGVHVTFRPNEAISHSDAVVVGEAEGVWKNVITEFQDGTLKRFYLNEALPSLEDIPSPRFDLLDSRKYRTNIFPVQATRGCPYRCEFCSVTQLYRRKVRTRPIVDVIRDVQLARASGAKWIFFVDENIIADPHYAKGLFQALIPLRIKWIAQSTIHIAFDSDLLDLAVKSGCFLLEIGLESVDTNNLGDVGKRVDSIEDYVRGIKMLQGKRIILGASMIFGFDNDRAEIFEKTYFFLQRNRVPIFDSYILTPAPGTELLGRLEKEKRVFCRDWGKYSGTEVVFFPKNMVPSYLQLKYGEIEKRFYSLKNIAKRLVQTPLRNLTVVAYVNLDRWRELRFAVS